MILPICWPISNYFCLEMAGKYFNVFLPLRLCILLQQYSQNFLILLITVFARISMYLSIIVIFILSKKWTAKTNQSVLPHFLVSFGFYFILDYFKFIFYFSYKSAQNQKSFESLSSYVKCSIFRRYEKELFFSAHPKWGA